MIGPSAIQAVRAIIRETAGRMSVSPASVASLRHRQRPYGAERSNDAARALAARKDRTAPNADLFLVHAIPARPETLRSGRIAIGC
jgi:hypothetical protein